MHAFLDHCLNDVPTPTTTARRSVRWFCEAAGQRHTSRQARTGSTWFYFVHLGFGRRRAVPGLRILTVGPGPRSDSWAYLTAGCWSTAESNGHGVEFVLSAPVRDRRFADLLAMTASYHSNHHLDLGHSLPIGEPWLPGSNCDHLLLSLPYLHGPDLEHCPLPDGHARILWVVPVTTAETAYRREHGHEALEQLFDEHAIVPTDPHRLSVA